MAMVEEEDVTYTSVVFKNKTNIQTGVKRREEETVYDEVKVRTESNEKNVRNSIKEEEIVYDDLKACNEKNDYTLDLNGTAVLLPDKTEESRRRWYQQLAWCYGTLFFTLLLGVIATCIYFSTFYNNGDLEQLKNNQTTLLKENYNLTNLNSKLSSDFEDLRRNHSNLSLQFDSLIEAFAVSESRVANLTTENQRLEWERRNLTERIENVETRWNEQNVSRAQWSIDAYCPKNNNGRMCKPCQNGWLSSLSSCYAINNADLSNRKTWEKAREDCRGKTSELVVVSDEREKRFVSEKSWGSSETQGYWIGLKAEDNKWKWVDGSELKNNSWIPQPPNDNQCVISVENQGWRSVQCDVKQQWICEMEALSV